MQRILKISKFRNIGLDDTQRLVLNNSMEKGKMGDLVIVIGPNNSGKSNALDALYEVGSESITQKDVTQLSFKDEDRKPKLSLIIEDDNTEVSLEKTLNGLTWNVKNKEDNFDDGLAKALEEVDKLGELFNAAGLRDTNFDNLSVSMKLADYDKNEAKKFLFSICEKLKTMSYRGNYAATNVLSKMKTSCPNICLLLDGKDDNSSAAESLIQNKCGISAKQSIMRYTERNITSSDMSANPDNVGNNLFFSGLFQSIGISTSEITNAYSQYRQYNNIQSLKKLSKDINKKMDKLNKRFNNMYFADKDKYSFSVSLDSNLVSFAMARGKDEEAIMIDSQSTGFRWFFNLFFGFLASNKLKAGDIIIMDEPATNLHPQGQIELRKFMKEFAQQNDITFVLATHSPFLIDPDNYDELRVVSIENNRSSIDNLFSAVNDNDPDSLLPIKESLTIKQNILYDLDTEVIWVEGITDYNYLTMFKKLLGIQNIAFLPFNGVGNNSERTKIILEKLCKIKFHKVNMLVDGDKAGKDMLNQCKGTKFENAVCISSVDTVKDKKPISVEDLFSLEDKKKYSVLNYKKAADYKKAYLTSVMKNSCKLGDFTEETVNNFKKLFELLID